MNSNLTSLGDPNELEALLEPPALEELRAPPLGYLNSNEAEPRLVELVESHWNRQLVVKESDSIANFIYRLRRKRKPHLN